MAFGLFFFSWRFCLTLCIIRENNRPLLVVCSPLHTNPGWQTHEHPEERFIRLYDLPNELHNSSQLTTDNGQMTTKRSRVICRLTIQVRGLVVLANWQRR